MGDCEITFTLVMRGEEGKFGTPAHSASSFNGYGSNKFGTPSPSESSVGLLRMRRFILTIVATPFVQKMTSTELLGPVKSGIHLKWPSNFPSNSSAGRFESAK